MRVGAFLPLIYHVGGHCFIVSACLAGASLVVGRKPVGADVAAAVARDGITALYTGSPQMVEALVDALERNDTFVPNLKLIIYGWGAISPGLYKRLLQRTGEDFVALVIFGQTEAISGHRFWPAQWPDVFERTAPELNYVGVPNPILASDVIDETGRSVLGRPGASGEAVYRSPVIAAGYYLDEPATREAFRGGWFHTGDSVRVDEHGLRIMVDRFKDIVKSGGENVSSQRVEAVLQAHSAVARAAVVGLPHDQWGEAVTAFVIRRAGGAASEAALIAHCRERLAGFETPKAVRFVDALPETVGGKILKYKLREQHADLYVPAP
jgi:acyl-CoA synthetase (AMP-forming)/AMP-acid ligase II